MNKKLLATLIVPLLGMTACGGNDFKEVKFFSAAGFAPVTEKGYVKSCKMVATYLVSAEDLEYLTANNYVGFPSSFAIYFEFDKIPGSDKAAFEAPKNVRIHNTGRVMELQENSEAVFENYTEVGYNEGKRTAKFTVHEDKVAEGSHGSYSTAYKADYNYVDYTLTISIPAGSDLPATKWTVSLPQHKFEEKQYERYVTYGEDTQVEYAFKD